MSTEMEGQAGKQHGAADVPQQETESKSEMEDDGKKTSISRTTGSVQYGCKPRLMKKAS